MKFFIIHGDEVREFEKFDEAARFIEKHDFTIEDTTMYNTREGEMNQLVFVR